VTPVELEAMVLKMRELGVDEFQEDGLRVKLGPDPKTPPRREPDPNKPPPLTAEERKHMTLFAASGIRPPLPVKEPRESVIPKAVVARERAKAAANGQAISKGEGR